MIQTIDIYQFRDAFQGDRKNQFSYAALVAIFDYYDEFPEMELDVIAICCDWMEYDSWDELVDNYDDLSTMTKDEGIEWLQDRTQILKVTDKDYMSGITSTSYLVHAF